MTSNTELLRHCDVTTLFSNSCLIDIDILFSAKIPSDISSDVGQLQSNVLSYVTVTRPTGGIPKKFSARFDSSLAGDQNVYTPNLIE